MKTEIAKKETTEVAKFDPEILKEMEGCFGAAEDAGAEDFIFPYISIQHPTSKLVVEGTAKPGSIFNCSSIVELGYKDKGMKFIPIKFYKRVTVYENAKIIDQYPWVPGKKIEYNRNDGKIEALTFIYFILTEQELATGIDIPGKFSFVKTSRKAGEKLTNSLLIQKNKVPPKASWANYFTMTTKLDTNANKQPYYVPEIAEAGPVPMEYQVKAYQWFKLLSNFEKTTKMENIINTANEEAVVVDVDTSDICTQF